MNNFDNIRKVNDKIYVLENQTLEQGSVPLFCKICSFPMKTIEDSVSYRKYQSCSYCEGKWKRSKFGDWENGWRPSIETEGWDDYIKERQIFGKTLINLK